VSVAASPVLVSPPPPQAVSTADEPAATAPKMEILFRKSLRENAWFAIFDAENLKMKQIAHIKAYTQAKSIHNNEFRIIPNSL
jgi:hypothetical protein